jgi:cobalt-zinc-cadmium efflux system outer membrane protein
MKKMFLICGFVALISVAAAEAQTPAAPVEGNLTSSAQAGMAQEPSAEPTASLPGLVDEALRANPGVQAALHTFEAQRRRVPQAKTLPDPTVGIGWAGNIAPFSVQEGDPSSYRGVSAAQQLLYPGKLKLRGEIASKEADAAYWDYEAVRRRVTAAVKSAYYDYFYYDKAIQITKNDKDLLQKLAAIAEARYRVGKGIQQDILKSQTEISLLLQRLTVLEQQRKTAQVRINTLLARDPEAPLPPAANIQQASLSYSLEQLYQLGRENDTNLHRQQEMVLRNERVINLAQKDYYPDLSIAYMYQQRPGLPDMNGFTFTVNVPVFYRTKQREAVRQATEEKISTQRSKDDRQNEVNFELKQQYLAAKASDDLLRLYSQGVVPQASLALESSMSSYQVGNVDFLSVLGNFSTVLNYEIDYYRELANYQMALAQLETIVGVDLTSAQNPPVQPPPRDLVPPPAQSSGNSRM